MRKKLLLFAAVGALFSQNPGIQRTVVHREDVTIPGREAVIARVELAPQARAGRHTHPGEEISVILEGELTLEVDGQPARVVKAGEALFVPARTIHAGKNAGKGKAVVLATYVVEKGQPVATPVK